MAGVDEPGTGGEAGVPWQATGARAWRAIVAPFAGSLALPDPQQWARLRAGVGDGWQDDYGALAWALDAVAAADARELGRAPVLAIAGPQGTGKSTLAQHLVAVAALRGARAAVLGLDDLYLPQADRMALAARVHPLLRTRGVPGTHDVALGLRLLDALQGTGLPEVPVQLVRPGDAEVENRLPVFDCPLPVFDCPLPVFDKGLDDRLPVSRWRTQRCPVDLVIVEGWCLGLPAQAERALADAVNALEATEDPDGRWRRWVNARLAQDYAPFFARFDRLLALLPPDFDAVLRWRTQQEQGLPEARRMDAPALARFIAHYERLTRHGLVAWPALAHWTVRLAADHRVAAVRGWTAAEG